MEVEDDGARLPEYADGTIVTHPADYFPKDRRRGKKDDGGIQEHLFLMPSVRHPERLDMVRLVYR